jgi:hypothetical protein
MSDGSVTIPSSLDEYKATIGDGLVGGASGLPPEDEYFCTNHRM